MRVTLVLATAAALAACGKSEKPAAPPVHKPKQIAVDAAVAKVHLEPVPAHVDPPAESGTPRPTQLASRSEHSCARMSDDTMRCWGGGDDWGQLGNGKTGKTDAVITPALDEVVQVGTGHGFSCARRRDGTVSCFGYNGQGQAGAPAGDGDALLALTPVAGLTDAIDLAVGLSSSCAVRADGTVWCWGQLDDGTGGARTPVEAKGVDHMMSISLYVQPCAIRVDGTVWCWQHGAAPAQVAGVSDAVEISAGQASTCVRTRTGDVACWGIDNSGQLGRGTAWDGTGGNVPANVPGVTGATTVVVGDTSACAAAGKQVLCWGAEGSAPTYPASCLRDTSNEGHGGAAAQWKFCPVATVVAGVDDPIALVDGAAICAATRKGQLLCWGGASKPAPFAL